MAAIKGLEALRGKCKVEIYSDSKYVVDALANGWAAKWRANGWQRNKREPAINPDLWGRLLELCEAHDVTLHWVKGHSGNPDNERCDRLATEAATQPGLPDDEPYELTMQMPLKREGRSPRSSCDEDSTSRTMNSVRIDLSSPDANRRKKAVFKAVDVPWWATLVAKRRHSSAHRALSQSGSPLHLLSESVYFLIVICLLRECKVPEVTLTKMTEKPRFLLLASQIKGLS